MSPNELLIKEVTSNDESLVSTTSLHSVAELTFQPMDYARVMEAVWASIRAPRQEWRRIQRAVLLSDVLMKFGSSRCVQELRDFVDRFKALVGFRYTDEEVERGAIIREKSRYLVEVLSDFRKVEIERDAARNQKKKCVGMSRDDVRRGNHKANMSFDDVKGYFAYEMNKGEGRGGMAKEDRKEESKEESREERVEEPKEGKRVMGVSSSQPEFVERSKQPPRFEPAAGAHDQKSLREGLTGGGQPIIAGGFNQPTQNFPPPQITSQYVQPAAPMYNRMAMPDAAINFPQPSQVPLVFNTPSGPITAPMQSMPIFNPGAVPGPSPYQNYYNQGAPGGYMQAGPSQIYPAQVNPQYNPYQATVNMPQMHPYPHPGFALNPSYSAVPPNPPGSHSTPMGPTGPMFSSASMNPGNNPHAQAKSNIKHNLPSIQAQVEPAKPLAKAVDLESLLMNLDGLENNKRK